LALDEPLGALDALTRISMQELLGRVWRELGFTAVIVTHDVAEAVILADRVIVLDEGRIKLDLDIPKEHPRHHGDPELAALQGRLLAAILGTD
jgi:sulfonate transport system ATP-binding protein